MAVWGCRILAVAICLAGLQVVQPAGAEVAASPPASGGGAATLAHDAAGQLVGMVDHTGAVFAYHYDAAGNITSVTSEGSPAVAALSVVPERVRPGEVVTVTGKGFDPVPSNNTVTVGGVNATVTAATESTLSFTVPAGVSSSTATISTPTGSATTPQITTLADGAPAISSFSPAVVTAGQQVTITATNLAADPTQNVVSINGTLGGVVSQTASAITVEVTETASSGPIRLTTPGGTAISPADLIVVPPGIDATKVIGPDRLQLGAAKTVSVPAGKTFLATFPATGKAGYSVVASTASGSYGAVTQAMYDSMNRRLEEADSSDSNGALFSEVNHISSDDYGTVALANTTTSTRSVTVTVYRVADVDAHAGVIGLDGTPKSLTTTVPGQDRFATFAGTTGQRVSIKAGPASAGSGYLRLLRPDGTQLGSILVSGGPSFMEPVTLTTSGPHRVEWDPNEATTSTVSVEAWDVPADTDAGVVTLDGTSTTLSTAVPGQKTYAMFAGTAGQRISFLAGPTSTSSGHLRVLRPDGTQLDSMTVGGGTSFMEPVTLTSTGAHRVVWDPSSWVTSTVPVKAWDVPADANAGVITLDATTKTLSNAVPGQKTYATFTGTVGQRISFQAGPTSTSSGYLRVLRPDGTQLDSMTVGGGTSFMEPVTLTSTGTHTVVWDPTGSVTSSVPVKAWDVPADANAGVITLDGTPKTLTTTVPGQKAFATFTGQTGSLTLTVSGSGSCCTKKILVQNSSGATVASRNNNGTLTFTGGTGTWKVVLDPTTTNTGSATVAISAPAPAMAPAAFNSSRLSLAAGQVAETSSAASSRGRRNNHQVIDHARSKDGVHRRNLATHGPAWFPSPANLAGEDWEVHQQPEAAARPRRAPAGVTALSGVVRDLDGSGIPAIKVTVSDHHVRTDAKGRFLLEDVPTGQVVLTVDGTRTAFPDRSYGVFRVPARVRKGETTVLRSVWFPRLDMRHTVRVTSPLRRDVVLTTPDIPGLKVKIPKGSVIRDVNGRVVHELGITALPTNRLPYPMPHATSVPVYFTVQPGGASIFPAGAQVIYPNNTAQAPGTTVDFVSYDPQHGWETYGHGRVSADGMRIRPNRDTRVWSMDGFSIGIGDLPLPGSGWIQDFVDWLSGDPVEISTGRLTDSHTDLAVDDVIPIELTRYHWQGDGESREFGLNTRLGYDWYLNQTVWHEEVDLYLPSGGMVHFSLAPNSPAPGPGVDVDLVPVNAPPQFQGARLITGTDTRTFELRLRNGDIWCFPWQSRPRWMRDKNGNQVTFVRPSDNGDLTRIIAPGGGWISLTYDSQHRVTSARDHAGRTVTYTYDTQGRLSTVTNPDNKVQTYTYDGTSGRIATITDARQVTYLVNTYDANGRVDTQTMPNGASYQFDYTLNASGEVTQTEVTGPNGATTLYDLDGQGHPVTVTEATGTTYAQTTTYTRNAQGRVDSVTDHAGRTTAFDYDTDDRPIRTTILAGTPDAKVVDERTYGPYDQPATITDASGETTRFDYDPNGNLASITDPLNHETTYTTNARGQTTSITTPTGRVTTIGYTGTVPTTVTDPLGRVTRVTRDTLGRPIATLDPAGSRTTTAYDVMNNPVQYTDELGRTSLFEYDANGNLTEFTDQRGHATSWTYDDAGNQNTMTDPLGKTATATYDHAGRITSSTTRAGIETVYDYDNLDRPTLIRYGVTATGEESTLTHTYDTTGRLETIEDSAHGTTAYTYSPYDQILTETSPEGTVTWTYDTAGRPKTVATNSQTPTTYTYDDAGQLTQATRGTQATTFDYDPDGLVTSEGDPGGWTTETDRDDAGNPTQLTYRHNGTIQGDLTYTYTANGLRRSVGGSLANLVAPTPRTGLVYDDANRLTTADGQAMTYDDDGNLIGDGTTSYTWDARGQLSALTRTGTTATFDYDAVGRRVERTVNTETRSWLHDGANPAAEITDDTITGELSSIGVDGWRTRTTGGVTDTYLTDALGSPIALGRDDGTLAAEMSYDPFGVPTSSGDARGSDIGFTGRQDDGTGLMYYRARYYNPTLGRFISEDPVGLAGGTNLYAYVDNSPTNATDPTGNLAQLAIACVGGAAFDAVATWGTQRLSGQKVNWSTVGTAAVTGCVAGAIGFGAGMWLGARLAAKGAPTVNVTERLAPHPVKPTEALDRWNEFLGPGPHTNIHPRTGVADPNRIVSADGRRSIRFGPQEMNSSPTKFHYHEETWSFDPSANAWQVDNLLVRVPFPKGAW